jgi:iron complex transport system ATP-binding protein
MEIPDNSITALLGPNGSGKTTILNLMLGMLKPGSGEIYIFNKPRIEYSPSDLKRLIGLVPQDENIPFDLALFEYILLGRAPHLGLLEQPGESDYRIAEEAIGTTGLESIKYRSLPSLSGGERQMAAITRVLVQETKILLLDEPTSHLDIANTRRVLELMKALMKKGKTILFTTHDPNAAASIADYVILLREGRIVRKGPVNNIFNSDNLTLTYGVKIQVIQNMKRPVVLTL